MWVIDAKLLNYVIFKPDEYYAVFYFGKTHGEIIVFPQINKNDIYVRKIRFQKRTKKNREETQVNVRILPLELISGRMFIPIINEISRITYDSNGLLPAFIEDSLQLNNKQPFSLMNLTEFGYKNIPDTLFMFSGQADKMQISYSESEISNRVRMLRVIYS